MCAIKKKLTRNGILIWNFLYMTLIIHMTEFLENLSQYTINRVRIQPKVSHLHYEREYTLLYFIGKNIIYSVYI